MAQTKGFSFSKLKKTKPIEISKDGPDDEVNVEEIVNEIDNKFPDIENKIQESKKSTGKKSTGKKTPDKKTPGENEIEILNQRILDLTTLFSTLKIQFADHVQKELIAESEPIARKDYSHVWKQWMQVKTFLRKGTRPSQKQAIDNFESYLKDLIK